jgi:hypothetical protein
VNTLVTKHRKLTQADLEYACSNDVQAACEQAGALRLGDLVLRMAEEILESRESRTAEHGTSATEGWTLTDEQLAGMALWDRDVILDERHRAVGAMLVSAAVREIRRLRSMEQRLLQWAERLEDDSPVGANIAADLRKRLKDVP